MSGLVETAFCRGIGFLFLFFWMFPAAVIFFGYLVYIAVMTVKELRKP